MKARSWRHDSLYHRLMSSYSVIIISLVLTIITIYISLLYHSIRQEEHKSSKNALAQLSQSMEDNVFSFTESFVTNYLLKDSNVHKYFTTPLLEQTNNQLYTAYNQVKQFLFTSNLYHSIYLYNVKAANIISTNGVYIIGSRQDRQDVNWLIHGDFPMQRRWMAMNDYLIHYSLPDTFRQDVVSLVMKYPVNARDDNYLGFVAVNLSVAEIYDSLNIQSTDNNYFLMFSPDGCLLASKDSYTFKDIDMAQLSEHIKQGETEFFIQLGGGNYDVLVTRGSHGFTYAYLCARSAALSRLTPVLSIAVIIALIAIIGPIVISMLLTRKIYLPIKLLTHRSIEVSKTFGQETESEKTEVAISSALDLLTQRVNILQNEIAAFEPERKNVLMRNIFGLNGPNSGRFGEHLKVLGLSFPYKTFLCIYVTFKNVQDIDRVVYHTMLYNLCYFIENIHFEGCVRLATNTIEAGASLLINYEEPDTEQRLMTVLNQYLASQCEYEPLFGISHACGLVNSLPVCYEGAKHAVEYHFLLPEKNTFKQQEADDWDEKPVVVDITLYTQLERAIKSADFSAAKESLQIIFDILTREVYRLESVKSELSLLYKLLADKDRVFAFEQNMPVQALFMQEAQDIDQAKTAIIVGCEKYCMERQVQMSNRLVDDIERIKAYIVESVNAYDMEKLTLSEVARQFGKNPNYLSSLFPEYTGQNFSEYVTEVKLEKAAQELTEPGAVIYCVANSIGYYNVSYFIRIFKIRYGCTPGQYYEQQMRKRGVAQ